MFRKQYWVWLSLAFNSTGSVVADNLLYEFRNDPEHIYNADEEELRSVMPENDRLIKRLMNKDLNPIGAILNYCEKNNIGVLTPDSFLYPASLHSIPAKPLVLYYKGTLPEFSEHLSIGVVGTRRLSGYGGNAAYSISYDLAKSGAIVVSGMAEGIDGVAHRGALDAMGKTVAILGSGIDVIYPKCNTEIYNELILRGLIMTEYAPGTPPNGWHFPQRNRIISALSDGVLVVEAAEKSGSLITAEYAKEQGRLLYAVPGKVGEYTSIGTNELIRNGAKMTVSANDIISDFKTLYAHTLRDPREAIDYSRPEMMVAPSVHRPRRPRTKPRVPENNYRSMSFDSDPRLGEAWEAAQEQNRILESLALEYPEEQLTKEGYETPKFWEQKKNAPQLHKLNSIQNENETELTKKDIGSADRASSKTRNKRAENDAPQKNEVPNALKVELSETEQKIVDLVAKNQKATADDLSVLGIPIHVLLSTITMLEIRGIVQQLPGGYYTLN